MRIVVVEPDAQTRQELTTCLVAGGYEVMAVSSGGEALQKLKSYPVPDLFVIDLAPTRRRVIQLLAALRSLYAPDVPALFIDRRGDRARRTGSLGPVVAPPFDRVQVFAAVDRLFPERPLKDTEPD